MKKLVTLATLITLTATGCASQTAHLRPKQISASHSETQAFFLGGIAQEKTLDAAKVCEGTQNVVKVESKQEASDVVLSVLTLGIYTPRTAKVFCNTP